MSNEKVTIIRLIVGLIKKILLNKISYIWNSYTHSRNTTKVELDLTNFHHVTKILFE